MERLGDAVVFDRKRTIAQSPFSERGVTSLWLSKCGWGSSTGVSACVRRGAHTICGKIWTMISGGKCQALVFSLPMA